MLEKSKQAYLCELEREARNKMIWSKKDNNENSTYICISDKKSLRRTTSEKSKQANLRELEREARNKMMKELAAKKNVTEVRRLTQEELLAEAKKTEEINLKSLGKF